MKRVFTHIVARIKSETPPFFKKVRGYAIALSGAGGSLMTLKSQYNIIWLPQRPLEYLIIAGIFITLTASVTSKTPPHKEDQ